MIRPGTHWSRDRTMTRAILSYFLPALTLALCALTAPARAGELRAGAAAHRRRGPATDRAADRHPRHARHDLGDALAHRPGARPRLAPRRAGRRRRRTRPALHRVAAAADRQERGRGGAPVHPGPRLRG